MSKISLAEKWQILLEVTKSSYWFLLIIVLLGILGIMLLNTNKKTKKRNKKIYIISSSIIVALIIILYHGPITNIFDYMMNNLFIAIYFPNLAIYFAALIITNIILWISLFHSKTSEIIKKTNIIIYILMNYLLVLILSIINKDNLDVFSQSSVYNNKNATALIELSSLIFIIWIIFLVIYKIILSYLTKGEKEKIKKVIVTKPIKVLPDNYEPIHVPNYSYGNINKKKEDIFEKEYQENKKLTQEFEKLLTVDDYKLLLKILKEQKEQEQREKQLNEEREIREKEKQEWLQFEQERKEAIRIEKERKEAFRLEQLRIEELQKKELEQEQEKFTELEMLYRGIR